MGLNKVNVLVVVLLSVNLALARTILEGPSSSDSIEAVAVAVGDPKVPLESSTRIGKHFIFIFGVVAQRLKKNRDLSF